MFSFLAKQSGAKAQQPNHPPDRPTRDMRLLEGEPEEEGGAAQQPQQSQRSRGATFRSLSTRSRSGLPSPSVYARVPTRTAGRGPQDPLPSMAGATTTMGAAPSKRLDQVLGQLELLNMEESDEVIQTLKRRYPQKFPLERSPSSHRFSYLDARQDVDLDGTSKDNLNEDDDDDAGIRSHATAVSVESDSSSENVPTKTKRAPLLSPRRAGTAAVATPSSPKRRPSHAGTTPVVQFSSNRYYCVEDDPTVKLEIHRLNSYDRQCQVHWLTREKTAKAGVNYEHQEGLLSFEPGEVEKEIFIKLYDDDNWGGTLEFEVCLDPERSHDCLFGEYMDIARVQRIDDDVFPTNRFRDDILQQRFEQLSVLQLFLEYFKLNMSVDQIRSGSVKTILLGVLKNIMFFVQLLMNIYLVDHVLMKDKDSHSEGKYLGMDAQHATLVAFVTLDLVTLAMFHVLDNAKCSWGVGGKARMCLCLGLSDAFLSYTDAIRAQLDSGELAQAMSSDTENLIKVGYINSLALFDMLGKIVISVCFQMVAPLLFGQKNASWVLWTVVLLPLAIMGLMAARLRSTQAHLQTCAFEHNRLVKDFSDTVTNYHLIADYGKAIERLDTHQDRVATYSTADRLTATVLMNNQYLISWLTKIVVAGYTLAGGLRVIDGSLSPGIFLTCLRVLLSMGGMWEKAYSMCLQIYTTAPALSRLVRLINLPKNHHDRMNWNLKRREETSRSMHALVGQAHIPASACALDLIPLRILELQFSLITYGASRSLGSNLEVVRDSPMYFRGLEIHQGNLVGIIGRHGLGKTTLLKVLGGSILPPCTHTSGSLFIPSHLRVLHVDGDPLFFRGSLYDNLVFGCRTGHEDASLDRVIKVCERLGVPSNITRMIDPEHDFELAWSKNLSHSEKHLLHLARALIANPDVLCLHRPMTKVTSQVCTQIIELMRDFVSCRGVELPLNMLTNRRLRTCIMTFERKLVLDSCDVVYQVKAGQIVRVNASKIHSQPTVNHLLRNQSEDLALSLSQQRMQEPPVPASEPEDTFPI